MSEDRTEIPKRQDYPEYVFVVNDEEYDEQFVFYNSLRQLGYGIALIPGGNDDADVVLDEGELRVMAADHVTRVKVGLLRDKFSNTPTSLTLGFINSRGAGDIFSYIRTGKLSTFVSKDPNDRTRLLDDPRVLNAAFMRAYEISDNFRQTLIIPSGLPRDLQEKRAEVDKYYEGLKAEGVRPMEVEEMGALVISVIREILKQSPELKPSPPKAA